MYRHEGRNSYAKFISALPQQLGPVIADWTKMPLLEIGKLSDKLMPLIVYNTSVLQLSSNETSDKIVLPKQNQSNRIPMGLQHFHSNQKPKGCRAHIYYTEQARTCKPLCR